MLESRWDRTPSLGGGRVRGHRDRNEAPGGGGEGRAWGGTVGPPVVGAGLAAGTQLEGLTPASLTETQPGLSGLGDSEPHHPGRCHARLSLSGLPRPRPSPPRPFPQGIPGELRVCPRSASLPP